jgi:hypothetical protein
VHISVPGLLGGATSGLKQTHGSVAQSLSTAVNNPTTQSLTGKVKSLLGYLLRP